MFAVLLFVFFYADRFINRISQECNLNQDRIGIVFVVCQKIDDNFQLYCETKQFSFFWPVLDCNDWFTCFNYIP